MFRRCVPLLAITVLVFPLQAETLRLSVADAVQRALHNGTQAQLARSAEERARITRTEAFGAS